TEMLIDYKIENGDSILVLKEVEPKVKAQLVSQGYPKSGFTYDIFADKVTLMTTDTEKAYYMTKQLEEEIAATIRLFDGVKDAKVQLTLGTDKKYILDSNKVDPTGSAVVIMMDGGSPTPEQVKGIQRLVMRSVAGLEFEKVSVIDGNGRDVSDAGGSSAANIQYNATTIKMQIERAVEEDARTKILHLLNPVFGADNLRVAVKSLVDIDKKIKEIINYIPSEDNRGVISNEMTSQQGQNGTDGEGGVPGAETNAEENVPVYPGVTTDGNKLIFQDDKSYEYLVSQVTEQIQSDAATYLDTTIAITVNAQDMDEEQINDIKRLIANAAGISIKDAGEKIEIVPMPFEVDNTLTPEIAKPSTRWLIIVVVAAVAAIVAGLLVFFITKKKRMAKVEETENQNASLLSELEEIRHKNKEGLDSIGDYRLGDVMETKVTKLQSEISDFAETNPAIVAQLIKTWLRGDEEDQQ
ncbi:MAG: flagellar M-ring protein FliF C-terminal domain-containing protein, partial [Oscillospiraceae bacterium]